MPRSTFCFVIVFAMQSVVLADDTLLKKRVYEEYPVALAKLEARYGSMHGKAHCREFKVNPSDKSLAEKTLNIDFAFSILNSRLSFTSEKTEVVASRDDRAIYQTIFAVNSKYWFRLLLVGHLPRLLP